MVAQKYFLQIAILFLLITEIIICLNYGNFIKAIENLCLD